MASNVQRYHVERPEEASHILPARVALVAPDGGVLLGELERLPDSTTVKKTAAAYNALIERLAALGLATIAESDKGDE